MWFEPTDIGNVHKVFAAGVMVVGEDMLTYASPNLNELRMMYNLCQGYDTVPKQGTETIVFYHLLAVTVHFRVSCN